MKEDSSHIPASVWRRISAAIIDSIIVALGTYIFRTFIRVDNQMVYTSINLLFGILYWVTITYKANGQTIGKYLVKTRVVALEGKLTIQKIIFRFFILDLFFVLPYIISNQEKVVSWIVVLLSVVMLGTMIRDKKHRGIHDLIAGTWVRKELS